MSHGNEDASLSALQEARNIGTVKEKAKWLRNKKLLEKLRRDHIDVDLLIGKKEDLPRLTCRERLLQALHKPIAQLLLALLMLVDSAIILAEIVVEVRMFVAEVHARDLQLERLANWMIIHVPPVNSKWNLHEIPRFVSNQTDEFIFFLDRVAKNISESSSCYVPTEEKGEKWPGEELQDELEEKALRKEAEMAKYELVIEILAITSIVVLGLFVIEVLLKFIAMGPKTFLKSKLEIFDALIIFASFGVDLGTFFKKEPNPEATVMIILLIWRIVRLVNGFLMHEKQTAESHNHIMQKIHKLMVFEVRYLKRSNEVLNAKMEHLKELCANYKVPDSEVNRVEASYHVSIEELLKQQEQEDAEGEHRHFPHNITVWFGQHKADPKHDAHATTSEGDNETVGFLAGK